MLPQGKEQAGQGVSAGFIRQALHKSCLARVPSVGWRAGNLVYPQGGNVRIKSIEAGCLRACAWVWREQIKVVLKLVLHAHMCL